MPDKYRVKPTILDLVRAIRKLVDKTEERLLNFGEEDPTEAERDLDESMARVWDYALAKTIDPDCDVSDVTVPRDALQHVSACMAHEATRSDEKLKETEQEQLSDAEAELARDNNTVKNVESKVDVCRKYDLTPEQLRPPQDSPVDSEFPENGVYIVDLLGKKTHYVPPGDEQERPPARETGGEVRPTGHNTPSPPGAVHSKEPCKYGEPWSVYQCDCIYSEEAITQCCGVRYGDGQFCHWTDSREECGHVAIKEYIQRSCDCVNALAGVPDPAKLMAAVKELARDRRHELGNQFEVDDVIEALEGEG